MKEKIRVAVVGASGYIGMQLVNLLSAHPQVELTHLYGRTNAGQRFCDVVPGSRVELVLQSGLDVKNVDVVFTALPHTVAAARAADWLEAGITVIDLSADFRLRDAGTYSAWYQISHPSADLCKTAVYALPELLAGGLEKAKLLAMPGCYATAAVLAVAPALRTGWFSEHVVVDAKSGVSGSGRSPSLGNLFAEVNESVSAYAITGHRHKAEILQELNLIATNSGKSVEMTFVPHLIPMTRGILVTAYLTAKHEADHDKITSIYKDFCSQHPFLRCLDNPPATKSVAGTNVAALNVAKQDETIIVTCAIDNLLKGASGQAVQAFNLRFGLEETTGLSTRANWP